MILDALKAILVGTMLIFAVISIDVFFRVSATLDVCAVEHATPCQLRPVPISVAPEASHE